MASSDFPTSPGSLPGRARAALQIERNVGHQRETPTRPMGRTLGYLCTCHTCRTGEQPLEQARAAANADDVVHPVAAGSVADELKDVHGGLQPQ